MFRPPRHVLIFVTFCVVARDVRMSVVTLYPPVCLLKIQLLPVTELALCAPLIIPITNRQISPFLYSLRLASPHTLGSEGTSGDVSVICDMGQEGELRVNTGEARELSVKYSLATLNLTSVNHLLGSLYYCPQILGLMIERINARH